MELSIYHHFPKRIRVEVDHKIIHPVHFNWKIERPELKERRKQAMLELGCTNEEKIKITVSPVTATGKAAPLDGPIAVTVQGGNGTVQPINDKSFYAVSGDTPGDTSFLVSGDADLGAGVEPVQDIVILHVAGAKAASLGMVAGAPEPK